MSGRIRRQIFQSDPELQQFLLREVRPTGRKLGVGSYGTVEELELNGLVCAGKRLHDALLNQGNIGATNIERKYLEECRVRWPTENVERTAVWTHSADSPEVKVCFDLIPKWPSSHTVASTRTLPATTNTVVV